MSEDMKGNVFITGSAGGIGAAITDLLVGQGYTVYAGVHSDRRSGSGSRAVPIDVTDPDSVAAAAEHVASEVGPAGLRAVINNAGIIVQGPLELVSPDQLRLQFEVNTFGPTYVTQAFLPLLRAGGGRVINISAPTARLPIPFLGPISASKAALSSLSDALRLELRAWRIPVVVVEPSATQTEIFTKAEQSAQAALVAADPTRTALYQYQLAAVAKTSAATKMEPVAAVAKTVAAAVSARAPKRRYSVGGGARMLGLLTHFPPGLRERALIAAAGLGAAARADGAR
ncbi:SDR family NAD(P)-dependent oxidoreductase [Nocardia sp. CA-129566]|uniref:SDR family NAD(P)-dependent oxidoreductase n=1 Tax=Nocardia sp. CA-129566 TaxID=3239976 RepID=UPI003D9516A4